MIKRIGNILITIYLIVISSNIPAQEISHSNFLCDDNRGRLSFKPAAIPEWYSITQGQPFDEEIKTGEGNKQNCLIIRAGRKASYNNAAWVKKMQLERGLSWIPDSATASSRASDPLPDKLNFAFIGTLYYERMGLFYRCENVIIGQGHYFGINNFWVFSNNQEEPHSLACYDLAGYKYFLYIKNSNNPTLIEGIKVEFEKPFTN